MLGVRFMLYRLTVKRGKDNRYLICLARLELSSGELLSLIGGLSLDCQALAAIEGFVSVHGQIGQTIETVPPFEVACAHANRMSEALTEWRLVVSRGRRAPYDQ